MPVSQSRHVHASGKTPHLLASIDEHAWRDRQDIRVDCNFVIHRIDTQPALLGLYSLSFDLLQ